jgi:hypothetical protein
LVDAAARGLRASPRAFRGIVNQPLCSVAKSMPGSSVATIEVVPTFTDITTWTDRLGHSRLRTYTDEQGHFWLEQNASKDSKWAKLSREGHKVAWEFEATKKFLKA